jgi:uncharacterized membrane protein YeaQ/YmgE (transglycosylase-associated protein family)
MTVQMVLLWIGIGISAGWIAQAMIGRGPGVLVDMALGVAGAVVATVLFAQLDVALPLGDLTGKILVALAGSVLVLAVAHLVTPAVPQGG